MQIINANESVLFDLDGRPDLAKSIIDYANGWKVDNKVSLGVMRDQTFSDGEHCPDFKTSVRGRRVYLLSSGHLDKTACDKALLTLMYSVDAARRSGAREIIPIIPYSPNSRQDKKDQTRGPILSAWTYQTLEFSGATAIITFDLHADQIEGYVKIPVTHIKGQDVFHNYVASIATPESTLCGPDAGSGKRVKRLQRKTNEKHNINLPIVMIDKDRATDVANTINSMELIGHVNGKDVILYDDILDTGGTLVKAVDLLFDKGAKTVRAIISHPVMSGDAYNKILSSKITELIVSDSLPIEKMGKKTNPNGTWDYATTSSKIKVVSIAQTFGMAIAAINNNLSFEVLKENEKENAG